MRRGVFVLLLAVAASMVALPAARAQTGTPVVFLDGKGFGHGVGLAQWGAKYLADGGASHQDILATFYPGTSLGTADDTDVRVAVYTSPNGQATLQFPYGGEVRSAPSGDQAPGFPVQVGPGGSVVVSYDGAYHASPVVTAQAASAPVEWQATQQANCVLPGITCPPPGGGGCLTCAPPTTPPPPDTTPPPPTEGTQPPPSDGTQPPPSATQATSTSPLWAVPADGATTGVAERGRHYRGLVEATADSGQLRLVNQLPVETYLRGMGEVPSTWPIEAIAAQTVAARTYALRAMSFSGELCDYDLCQVYIGADRETAGQNAAVDETAGEVVTYGGALASTVYSADAGGITATTLEGFGSPDGVYPYLTVVHYATPDPLPWRTEVALSDVASRFGYPGTLTGLSISRAGPSGRALQVTLDGSAGATAVDGRAFAAGLGLRSTLFQPTIGTDDNPPPPPAADGGAIQALPDDAAAMHSAASTAQSDAALQLANLRAMRDWGNGLLAGMRRAHPADLAHRPMTWVVLLLAALATAFGLQRTTNAPPPFALQLADRRAWRPSWHAFRLAPALVDPAPPAEDLATWIDPPPLPPGWAPLFAAGPDANRPAPKGRPVRRLRLRRRTD